MNNSLYKFSLKNYFTDSLFYILSAFTILFTGFCFFFVNRFFLEGSSSADLRSFFSYLSFTFVILVPLLTFKQSFLIKSDFFPVSHFSKTLTLILSQFTVSLLPVILLIFLPVTVNFFGQVDFGQCFAGFFGIFLVLFCQISFSYLIFSIFKNRNFAIPLFITIIILFLLNFIHLLPLYFPLSDVLSNLFQKVSFAWHSEPFCKGIIDSREISFLLFSSFSFILLTSFTEYKISGRRIDKKTVILLFFTVIFSFLWTERIYFRKDLSSSKKYSLSDTTKTLLSKLDSPLKISYFYSKELNQYYPSTKDIAELLKEYNRSNKNVLLKLENVDSAKAKAMQLPFEQLKLENSSKTEYITVYSSILVEYENQSELIPFILSSSTLEFDLTNRIQKFVSKNERNVFVYAGNGFSINEDYSILVSYLKTKGFNVSEIAQNQLSNFLDNISVQNINDSTLIVLGSNKISLQQSESLKKACENGLGTIFLTSPFTSDIKGSWEIQYNKNDFVIQLLNDWGFSFDLSLVQDLSNFSLTMENSLNDKTSFVTENYPLWIKVLPQKNVISPLTLFWSSPVSCYGNVEPIFYSSEKAWKQLPDFNDEMIFIVNPFLIQKESESVKNYDKFTLAAKLSDEKKKIVLIGDQFFVSSLMTGFISSGENPDLNNFDFIAKEIYSLRNEKELAALMEKKDNRNYLYKITDNKKFQAAQKNTIYLIFIILPSLFIGFGIIYNLIRKILNRK